MAYRDILVHLDAGDRDGLRLGIALDLARRFGGRVTGLFARIEHFGPSLVAGKASHAFAEAAAESERLFAEATRDCGVPVRWWSLSHGDAGHVVAETVVCARVADLVVLGQHHQAKDAPSELIEHVLLHSGTPCLIVPSAGDHASVGATVLVAWNGGREAARAMHDAMPLMETARTVEILTVRQEEGGVRRDTLPPVSLRDHFAVHGIEASREMLAGEDIGVMDLILSRACDLGADLLVMGGHGGYSLPFMRGAGTRYMLRHMTLPVLMSS